MIYELLLEGAENAQTGKELCKVLSITPRTLNAVVEMERRQGQPICASTGKTPGYYLAANQKEMRQYCASLLHRAGELHKTRNACIKTIDSLPT